MLWNLTVINPLTGEKRHAEQLTSKAKLFFELNRFLNELETNRTVSISQLNIILATGKENRGPLERSFDGYFIFEKTLTTGKKKGQRFRIADGNKTPIEPEENEP